MQISRIRMESERSQNLNWSLMLSVLSYGRHEEIIHKPTEDEEMVAHDEKRIHHALGYKIPEQAYQENL